MKGVLEPLVRCLACLGSFVAGSGRILLFLCCLVMLLLQLAVVGMISSDASGRFMVAVAQSAAPIVYPILLILLTGFGCLVSFYNHSSGLKLLSVLLVASTVYSIFGDYRTYDSELYRKNEQLFDKLEQYKYNYQWHHKAPFETNLSNQTKLWDLIQSQDCCGTDNKTTWDKVRPHNIADDLYPITCCKASAVHKQEDGFELCKAPDVMPKGCKQVIEMAQSYYRSLSILQIIAQLFMFILSLMAQCSCKSANEQTNYYNY